MPDFLNKSPGAEGDEETPRKNIMRRFVLKEISAVDVPAQEPALATIMKRRDKTEGIDTGTGPDGKPKKTEDEDDEKEKKVRKARLMMLTTEVDDHQHSVSLHRYTIEEGGGHTSHEGGSAEESHSHPFVLNEDGTVEIGIVNGHSHEVTVSVLDRLRANMISPSSGESVLAAAKRMLDDIGDKADKSASTHLNTAENGGTSKESTMDKDQTFTAAQLDEAVQKAVAEAVAPVQAELDIAKAEASMSDEQRDYAKSLSSEDREIFVALSGEDRNSEIAKAKEEDQVVYKAVNGTEYRASDDPRLVAMAKERDEDRKEVIKAQAAAKNAELTKRAETELANVPGTVETRVALLKAVDGIENEEVRGEVTKSLVAHNAAMGDALTTVGTTQGQDLNTVQKSAGANEAEAELDRLAKERATAESEDYFTAYEKVSESNPQLLAKALG